MKPGHDSAPYWSAPYWTGRWALWDMPSSHGDSPETGRAFGTDPGEEDVAWICWDVSGGDCCIVKPSYNRPTRNLPSGQTIPVSVQRETPPHLRIVTLAVGFAGRCVQRTSCSVWGTSRHPGDYAVLEVGLIRRSTKGCNFPCATAYTIVPIRYEKNARHALPPSNG